MIGPRPQGEATTGEERSDTERAEDMVEELAARVGDWTAKALARVHEEADRSTAGRGATTDQDSEASGRTKAGPSSQPRGEDTVEEWATRVGDWTAKAVARAREEAEDIWAEAKSLHRARRQ